MMESDNKHNNNEANEPPQPQPRVFDIGINLTNKAFRKHWRAVVRHTIDEGVNHILLTRTSLKGSRKSLDLAQTWY
jgi:Tat protein secretion system quality control protein TatD with DNase activity